MKSIDIFYIFFEGKNICFFPSGDCVPVSACYLLASNSAALRLGKFGASEIPSGREIRRRMQIPTSDFGVESTPGNSINKVADRRMDERTRPLMSRVASSYPKM